MITINMSEEEAKALKFLVSYSISMRIPLGTMPETCLVQIEKQIGYSSGRSIEFENYSSQFESLSGK